MIVGSPRQALAYLFACEKGPGMARPRYHDAPPSTDRTWHDHAIVQVMLYGPRKLGNCGVVRGSKLDLELRLWASEKPDPGETYRTDQVLAIERRMRALLRTHGMMPARRRFAARRQLDTGDGTPTLRAVGFTDEAQAKQLAPLSKMCSDFRSLG